MVYTIIARGRNTRSMWSKQQKKSYKEHLDEEQKDALALFRDDTWQNGRGMLITVFEEEQKERRANYCILLVRARGDCYWGGMNDLTQALGTFARAVEAYRRGGCMAASEAIKRDSETPFP
jgi:hypothetical protein